MKKLLSIAAILFAALACNNAGNNETSGTDTVGLTNPSAIDTAIHPSGMTNSNVISTDTAAINVQNSIEKAKTDSNK